MNDLVKEKVWVRKLIKIEEQFDPQSQHETLKLNMRSSIPAQQARLATLLKVTAYFSEKKLNFEAKLFSLVRAYL